MKTKTSITISEDILGQIDRHVKGEKNRSAFIELAVRTYLEMLERRKRDENDIAIINRNADKLNREATDVLSYQVEL
jgi:metal-responsive CopG/Arc/MetJ family transcriptional regulator